MYRIIIIIIFKNICKVLDYIEMVHTFRIHRGETSLTNTGLTGKLRDVVYIGIIYTGRFRVACNQHIGTLICILLKGQILEQIKGTRRTYKNNN